MGLRLENLDADTRREMLAELDEDARAGRLNPGQLATAGGTASWPSLLQSAAKDGNDESLAAALRNSDYFVAETTVRTPSGGTTTKRTPSNAAENLAQGEFNRLYIRALCRRAIAAGTNVVEVYRARASSNPRFESQELVGSKLVASELLEDLRSNVGRATRLGVPGVGSGLSVRLV